MGDIIDLQKLRSDDSLVADCARYGEALFSEADVKKRHRLPDSVWEALGGDDLFVEKVEAEKLRRVRNGNAKRERAQQLVTKAPDVLGGIMLDEHASPKHRIDSAKVLDTFAANGPEAAPTEDKFTIVINLGGDEKLVFSKSRTPDPRDGEIIEHDDSNTNTNNESWLPALAAKKNSEPSGGMPW